MAAAPETNLFRHAENFESFTAGDRVFSSGEPGTTMYAVRSGEVELQVAGTPVELVGAGGFFGEMALIEHDVRSATAVAKTDCELVPVDQKRFEFLVQQTPFFAMTVLRVMARRLRQMNER